MGKMAGYVRHTSFKNETVTRLKRMYLSIPARLYINTVRFHCLFDLTSHRNMRKSLGSLDSNGQIPLDTTTEENALPHRTRTSSEMNETTDATWYDKGSHESVHVFSWCFVDACVDWCHVGGPFRSRRLGRSRTSASATDPTWPSASA